MRFDIEVLVLDAELSAVAKWEIIDLCLIASPVSSSLFVLYVLKIDSFGESALFILLSNFHQFYVLY